MTIVELPFVVFVDPRYQGRRTTLLPGEYPNANFLPADNAVSSVRLGVA